MTSPRLLAVTDLASAGEAEHLEAYERAAALLPSGSFWVQLRGHGEGARRLVSFGRALLARLSPLGVRLVVNDRLDVALALGCRAAHLGGQSVSIVEARALLGQGAWLSVACHAPGEVAAAERDGADAALLSPIFASPGKGEPLGVGALSEARVLAPRIALLALGGVDDQSAEACLLAGASGIAAIRGARAPGLAEKLARLA